MKKNNLFIFIISILFIQISLAQENNSQNRTTKNFTNLTNADSLEGYSLVWSDEFDGTAIDLNNWTHEVNALGDYNGAVQYYTAREENSFIEDGKLIIKAISEHYVGPEGTREFTSARMVTKNKAEWKYGKVFVRAKLPKGVGTWPAIWVMPTDNSLHGSWPNSGEIDIMEHVGHAQDWVHGTIHTKAYNHRAGTAKGNSVFRPGVSNEFHTYSIEWTEDFIEIALDGNPYFKFNNEYKTWEEWPFDNEFHMILNIAIGGGWGGQQGIDTSAFPTQLEVDYVRVYQKSESLNSEKFFVKHAGDGWASHLMNDKGQSGDKLANDKIYSRQLTIDLNQDVKIDWNVADTNNTDVSEISWFYNPTGSNEILFTYDKNNYEDDWLPDSNFVNSNEELSGNFTVKIFNETDTLQFINEMTDDGDLQNGDQNTDDKVWSLKKEITEPGNYKWYIYHNIPSWAEQKRWSQYGKITSWSYDYVVEFKTFHENQNVNFYLDISTGRVLTKIDSIVIPPEHKTYYIKHAGDSWVEHLLYDDGTNGDETSDDGIYSLLLTVEQTDDIKLDWKIVNDNDANVSPNLWFYNPTGNQDILFTYDINRYSDMWRPKFNIANSTEELDNKFTIVLKSDTETFIFANEMTDDGNTENGDSTANDKIFSLRKNLLAPGKYNWFVYYKDAEVMWNQKGKTSNKNSEDGFKFITFVENQGVNFYLDLNIGKITSKVDPNAQFHYKDFFAKNDSDGWKDHLMRDDGGFGDEIANDGIYSRILPIAPNPRKTDWTINGNQHNQIGNVSWLHNHEGKNILFTLDTKVYNDCWLPKTNIKNTNEVEILNGPFTINLDTTAYHNIMTDDGNIDNGDTLAEDKIYAAHIVVENVGEHKWFAYFGDLHQRRWDANGKQMGWVGAFPDSVKFETTVANQDVYFYVNVNTGRVTTKSTSTLVGIKKTDTEELPKGFELFQNYPNAFNPTTKIKYSIPSSSHLGKGRTEVGLVTLKVYDILGREVATLVNKEQPAGTYQVNFDASSLTSGIYFYRIKIGSFIKSKNMILLK